MNLADLIFERIKHGDDKHQQWLREESRKVAAEWVAQAVTPFVVKHYGGDPFPTIKGNGFDGLQVGTDREEAEDFVKWVNERLICSADRYAPPTPHAPPHHASVVTEHAAPTIASSTTESADPLREWYPGDKYTIGPYDAISALKGARYTIITPGDQPFMARVVAEVPDLETARKIVHALNGRKP